MLQITLPPLSTGIHGAKLMDPRISGMIGVVGLLGGMAGLGIFLQSHNSGVVPRHEPVPDGTHPNHENGHAGNPPETTLRRYNDGEGVYAAAQSVISETGNTCPRATDVFLVTDTPSSSGFILKVVCAGGSEYQVTNIGGRVFVKPWSGNLFGH